MKIFTRLANKNKASEPQEWERVYEALIESKIRARYSVNQELATLRQRDTKPAEFAAYNTYVEKCKAEAKEEFARAEQ